MSRLRPRGFGDAILKSISEIFVPTDSTRLPFDGSGDLKMKEAAN